MMGHIYEYSVVNKLLTTVLFPLFCEVGTTALRRGMAEVPGMREDLAYGNVGNTPWSMRY